MRQSLTEASQYDRNWHIHWKQSALQQQGRHMQMLMDDIQCNLLPV